MEAAAQGVIYNFNILEIVPLDGTISYEEIAHKTGLPVNRVRQIIYVSILKKIFHEPVPGQVAHTPASAMLVHDRYIRALYGHILEETVQAAPKLAQQLKQNPASTSTAETSWNIAFNTKGTPFEFLDKHPDRLQRFFKAMEGISRRPGYSLNYVINGFDWAGLSEGAKVVDVCFLLLILPSP